MPRLSDAERREAILAALKRKNINAVAGEYGVSRQSLHRLVTEAKRDAHEQSAFWAQVEKLTSS